MKYFLFITFGLLVFNNASGQTGNVGIGTSNPTSKLHVNGSIKITDGTQGAGKVLTSDAAGKGTWQTAIAPPPSDPSANYPAVSIGCATWMTKNLDVSTYRNGDPIPKLSNGAAWIADTLGAYCYFNNDSTTYAAVYGKLYNWYAVNNPKGLAPEGWHIASDFEWTTLVNTLGGVQVAGAMMKKISTSVWDEPNLGATNLSNFSALPGGYRGIQSGFNVEGQYGYWWTSTAGDATIAWSRHLNYNDTFIGAAGANMHLGYSVRCVKD